ncbi:NAD(P)H-hydrate dehydratase [Aestuariibaculum sediminum]|uniref:Bifunctional NAD(P)H-hydrate repair enzyme n=1 Tax=Aestuariibaculum sediminum TaxID=2770637 RepID=A0A8J6Q105_9FLAO|nr:NAD(P)H-hydrate dehydratase [Aestuariibaculum sediminum]MBD0833678.1 NAD(P)H-hydrate dehydratase [Aestuariibaculum sediminum]
MKIFSKEQIYKGDRLTVERQNISSTDLMERAGIQIFNWIHQHMQGAQVPIHIFCGIGNNGGDGLVLARHLILDGYNVKTYIVNYSDKRSKDFLINYDRIKQVTKDWPTLLKEGDEFPEIREKDIIVDAIFGIGLNRPIQRWVLLLFKHLDASRAFTLSVDIPSGLQTNKVPESDLCVVKANYTLSFVNPKLVFFLPDTAKFTDQWEVLDIGFDNTYIFETETEANVIGKNEVIPLYIPRNRFSHKGHFGHALIVGGSYGKIGAVILASKAALATGAGLVSSYVPKCGYIPLQSSFPEAMVITDNNEMEITNISYNFEPTVIGIGIGMGTSENTIDAFSKYLETNKKPLVVDADGLNILSKSLDLMSYLPKGSVLTPHPKELERLIGTWDDDFDKIDKVKAFSKKYKVVVVIKGAHTITVYENKLYINATGNPGMATAGSGDVLTGIITGLVAQGYEPLIAAVFGVYLHGKSGDIASEDYGYENLIASHIISYLGEGFLDLFKRPETTQQQEQEENK